MNFDINERIYRSADFSSSGGIISVMDDYHKRYLTGELYNAANNYEGPGENVGNGTFSIGTYNRQPEEFSPDNEVGWRAGSDAWVNWFKENAPHVETHIYLRDEVWSHGAVYDDMIERCQWIHNNPGPGRALMTYVTGPIISELQGLCDFWSMNGRTCYLPDIKHEQSQGRKCGIYNGHRPFYGEDSIVTDAIDWRVQPWICWRYNLDQYFYWQTTSWNHWRGPKGDVFTKNRNNGNGFLFYPGEDVIFPESSRELPGPLSSVRMKNWRRGMQDYEYLWLARESGLESEVDAIVKSCVPAALSEAGKSISWSKRGSGFELYRRQLANLIAGKTAEIIGKVTDKATGDPIQGAKVTDGIGEGVTNAVGTYSMDAIPGTRTFTASAIGYEDAVQAGVIVVAIVHGATAVDFQLAQDTTPPIISNVQASRVISTKATISWNTDEVCRERIGYGTSPGLHEGAGGMVSSYCRTAHIMNIEELSPDTTYYYVVSSMDISGNKATSTEHQFKTPMALDLVGLWHFDEGGGTTAHDSSGFGNDEALVKGPTWVDGKIGKALEFDGVDDYVDCGNPASLDNIMDEITFTAWVKPFKDDGCIIKKWEWSNYSGYHFNIYTGVYDSTFNLKMGYGDKTLLILGMALHLNEFSHIAFTASDSEVILYLNGSIASRTVPRQPLNLRNSRDVVIGGGSGWSGNYFKGVIDEVKIYGRALSAEEIKADYEKVSSSGEK